jgi:glycosyltransferase involved in cell wall biosynthesis
MPPTPSGIAAYSAELVPQLASRGFSIDTFTQSNAHEFVWMRRRQPYDLTVYQLGNASYHDFMWGYLFRYPGLVALHDAQLHQARALALTRRWQPRTADYIAEVRANHPDAPADLPYLVPSRMADRMYQHWPMIKLVIESAPVTLVHNQWLASDLQKKFPAATVRAINMGVDDPLQAPLLTVDVRARHHIPADAVVVTAFGGVTPEKRIPQLIRAAASLADSHPNVHLILVGSSADHYDAQSNAEAAAMAERVHVTGFVPDKELPSYLLAADVCACLRWPTNRETSASWLRCIAAGRPTIITDLAHQGDVPTLDPRQWRVLDTSYPAREPVAVSIDILDEEHSIRLAIERLAADTSLRGRLGAAARRWWAAHHQLSMMADAYEHVLVDAARRTESTAASAELPAHLIDDGSSALERLTEELGLTDIALSLRLLRG